MSWAIRMRSGITLAFAQVLCEEPHEVAGGLEDAGDEHQGLADALCEELAVVALRQAGLGCIPVQATNGLHVQRGDVLLDDEPQLDVLLLAVQHERDGESHVPTSKGIVDVQQAPAWQGIVAAPFTSRLDHLHTLKVRIAARKLGTHMLDNPRTIRV